MPDTEEDPAADTQMFRAFMERGDRDQPRFRRALIIGACGLVLVLVVVIVAIQLS